MNESTSWNGYAIYGDSVEIDKMIATTNIISLDKNDIIGVLSRGGEHRIATGVGVDCESALNAALSSRGSLLEDITAMIVNIYCKDKSQLLMSEISSLLEPIKECISADCDLLWGFAEDTEIECPRKITLLVTSRE